MNEAQAPSSSSAESSARARQGLLRCAPAPAGGLIFGEGPDLADYLERRLTVGLTALVPGEGRRAMLLGAKGRIIALLTAHRLAPERFLLRCEGGDPVALLRQLADFTFSKRAEFRTGEAGWQACLLLGPEAGRTAHAALGAPAELPPEGVWQHPEGPFCLRHDLGRIAGRLLLGPEGSFDNIEAAPLSDEALECLRIEEGEPAYGAEWDEKSIPLDVGLARCIDFDKGCFPGQEIVARIRNLGHPARALVGLRPEGGDPGPDWRAGAKLEAEGKQVGHLTSAARSPRLGPVALAVLRWDQREPGTRLALEGGGAVRVEALPLD